MTVEITGSDLPVEQNLANRGERESRETHFPQSRVHCLLLVACAVSQLQKRELVLVVSHSLKTRRTELEVLREEVSSGTPGVSELLVLREAHQHIEVAGREENGVAEGIPRERDELLLVLPR